MRLLSMQVPTHIPVYTTIEDGWIPNRMRRSVDIILFSTLRDVYNTRKIFLANLADE